MAFSSTKKIGDEVIPGDVIGYVQESKLVRHQIMALYGYKGRLSMIEEQEGTIEDVIARLRLLQA